MRRYRDREEECRAHAAVIHDQTARNGLIQVAQSYERMAEAIEDTLPDDSPPKNPLAATERGTRTSAVATLCRTVPVGRGQPGTGTAQPGKDGAE